MPTKLKSFVGFYKAVKLVPQYWESVAEFPVVVKKDG